MRRLQLLFSVTLLVGGIAPSASSASSRPSSDSLTRTLAWSAAPATPARWTGWRDAIGIPALNARRSISVPCASKFPCVECLRGGISLAAASPCRCRESVRRNAPATMRSRNPALRWLVRTAAGRHGPRGWTHRRPCGDVTLRFRSGTPAASLPAPHASHTRAGSLKRRE